MTTRRTFTAAELGRLFKRIAREPDFAVDLGDGRRTVQMAAHDGDLFTLEKDGGTIRLADADAEILEKISAVLWERFGEFIGPDAAGDAEALTPDAKKLDALLTPDELLSKPEGDPLGYPGDE